MSNKGKIIIALLVAILASVIAYLVIHLNKVKNAAMTYAGVNIKSLSLTRIELTAYFKSINTGAASVTLSNQEYDVYMNDKFVTHMKYSQPFVIKPGVNIMPLEVSIKIGDVLKAGWSNLRDIITDKSKVNITLKGSYTLKIGFLTFSKVALNETFNLGSMGSPS